MLFSPVQAASGECTAGRRCDQTSLSPDIRHSATLFSFKSKLKTFLFSEYFRRRDRQTDRDTERQIETDRGRQRQITKRERNQETRLVSLNDEFSYSS